MNCTPKKIFSRFGFAQLAGELASIALSFLLLMPLASPENLKKVLDTAGPGAAIFLMYVPNLGYLLLFWCVIRKIPKVQWEKSGMRFGELVQVFLMMYGLSQILNFAGIAVTSAAPAGQAEQTELFESLVTSRILMGVLLPVVIAPVLEELIFRKLMIDRLHGFGETTVIVFTALCFGLYHGNFTQLLYTTVVGLFLGYVYCRTGKILLTLLMHMLLNGTSSMILLLLPLMEGDPSSLGAALLLLIPGIAAMIIAGLILTFRHLKKGDVRLDDAMPSAIPKGEVLRTVYLNPGMLLLFLFSVSAVVTDLLGIDVSSLFMK